MSTRAKRERQRLHREHSCHPTNHIPTMIFKKNVQKRLLESNKASTPAECKFGWVVPVPIWFWLFNKTTGRRRWSWQYSPVWLQFSQCLMKEIEEEGFKEKVATGTVPSSATLLQVRYLQYFLSGFVFQKLSFHSDNLMKPPWARSWP